MNLEALRKEAAVGYLKGIRVAVEQQVPYGALPELPPGITVRGAGPDAKRLRAEGERRYAAHQERKELERRIAKRRDLEAHLLYLYALKPRNEPELRSLCEQHLGDDVAVAKTMERLQLAIDEVEGKVLNGQSVLNPMMPLELRKEIRYGETGKHLEGARI